MGHQKEYLIDYRYRPDGYYKSTRDEMVEYIPDGMQKSIEQMFRILKYDIERLEGIHPTSSRTYKLINALLFNSLCDVRYKHYSVVAKPR